MMRRIALFLAGLILILWQLPLYGEGLTVGFLAGVGGLGDESYNDMTLAGLAEARKLYKFDLIHEVSDATRPGIERSVRGLIAKGAGIVVSNRIAFPDILHKAAREHPEIKFVLNDMPWGKIPNVVSIGYDQHEGAFLVGALAAWFSKSRNIAFIGGTDIPVIASFSSGFREGVRYASPEATLIERFVAEGVDASGFDNPKRAFDMASALYESGVDVIFAAAGLSGNGVIHAAKVKDRFVIGVDTDQDHMAKGNVLTSMMKRLDTATFQEVSRIIEGRFQAGVRYYGLKEGGIGLSPMKYTRDLIGDALLAKVEKTRQRIVDDEIAVTRVDYLGQ